MIKKQNLENGVENNEENLEKEKLHICEDKFRKIIDKNIFCIDLLDNNFPFEFPGLFSSMKSIIEKNIEPCDLILKSIESFEMQKEDKRSSNYVSNNLI